MVIPDRTMPGIEGEQTLREIESFPPESRIIMLTGEQLVARVDFLKYGAVILILSFAALWS